MRKKDADLIERKRTQRCPSITYVTTLLLSLLIFCGFGGVHRIYAGKVITGVIQFLTGGGFIVWQVIDIIRIILGCFDDKEGRTI